MFTRIFRLLGFGDSIELEGEPQAQQKCSVLLGLIADLEIPAIGIEHVEALEVLPHHVGPRIQAAAISSLTRLQATRPIEPMFIVH